MWSRESSKDQIESSGGTHSAARPEFSHVGSKSTCKTQTINTVKWACLNIWVGDDDDMKMYLSENDNRSGFRVCGLFLKQILFFGDD